MTQISLQRLILIFVAAAIIGLYIHAILYLPITFSDQFHDIYVSMTISLRQFLESVVGHTMFFRPGEHILRTLLIALFGSTPFAYNYFQMLFVIVAGIGAVSLIECRDWTDAGAGITALTFFFGHHAFVSVMEAHITLSNGLVLLIMMVSLWILQSRQTLTSQVLAIALSTLAVLTKEVGLLVPFTLVAGTAFGFRGVGRWTAALLFLLMVSYVAFRLHTLPELETSSVEHLSNIIATPVMIITGEPFDGKWQEFLHRQFLPWRIIRIVLGLGTVLLILIAFFLRKTAAKAFPQSELVDGKWMLLILSIVAASAAVAFEYTRHRMGAMALPVVFVLLHRSLRIVIWRLSTLNVRTPIMIAVVSLLTVFSLGWSTRVADGFFVIRYMGSKTMVDWIEHYQKYRQYEAAPKALSLLDSFFWAAQEMPWPTVESDGPFIRHWLGDEDVMNR